MVMRKAEGEGGRERLKKGAFARYLLVCCASAFIIGAGGAAVIGAAGDTIADRELGQIDLVHNGPNLVDGVGLWTPAAAALDTSVSPNRLYVADSINSRVLRWDGAAPVLTGAPADLVVGQTDVFSSDFTAGCGPPTADNLCSPAGVAVDHKGNLYVADSANNRVLEYFAPVINHPNANVVFGQLGSFTSGIGNNGGGSGDNLSCSQRVAIDSRQQHHEMSQPHNPVLVFYLDI